MSDWQVADISGKGWDPAAPSDDGYAWHPAEVPISIHEWLLSRGEITDPQEGANAADSEWVGEHDWALRRDFSSPLVPQSGRVYLQISELDTVATLYVNGQLVLRSANMFRTHRIDVTSLLAPAGDANTLVAILESAPHAVQEIVPPANHRSLLARQQYLRKGAGDFASYLGMRPQFVKVGIGRVELDVTERLAIDGLRISQQIGSDRAVVSVTPTLGGHGDAKLTWRLVRPDGESQTGSQLGSDSWEIEILNPELWWPRSHGPSPLYRLEVEVSDSVGAVLDRRVETLGLRTIVLETQDPSTQEPIFRFLVNGVPIYAKGANWANLVGISNIWDSDRANALLDLVERGEMNMLRVWGGGHLPVREFYEQCDRRGILVWQDFMFEYHAYPGDVAEFAQDVRLEVAGFVRELRNHACVVIWCGGNENHMGWQFQYGSAPQIGESLFSELIAGVVAELDGTRPYHPSSPFGGIEANTPGEGDWHDYTTLTWSPGTSVPAFVSETGRVSAPSLRSMARFLNPDELWPAGHDATVRVPGTPMWPDMWGYRAPDGAWDKVGEVEHYLEPKSAGDLIRVLGMAHGEYLQQRVERQRRGRPNGQASGPRRNWGNLVWRLNDPWPILYWSVIDSYLQPKVPFYFLQRAYAPVLLSFEESADDLHVWVTNDTADRFDAELTVSREEFAGDVLASATISVSVGPGESRRVFDAGSLGAVVRRSQLLHARANEMRATWLATGERHLHLPEARLSIESTPAGLVLSTDSFARSVVVDLVEENGSVAAANYFDLPASATQLIGASQEVAVSALNARRIVTFPSSATETKEPSRP
ncbi:glycoside hydrolase family 2 TIM barrel-domain containing protein [Microbacterium sp. LWS13-1.2]|uniref:beta-mannosidase n=1 Tax=Microbacterium sp. LWS13-1.2 TaxID=3135264 RepID=A0AAU6SAQ7_9MICO